MFTGVVPATDFVKRATSIRMTQRGYISVDKVSEIVPLYLAIRNKSCLKVNRERWATSLDWGTFLCDTAEICLPRQIFYETIMNELRFVNFLEMQ